MQDVVDRYAARQGSSWAGWAQVNGWRGETTRVEFDLYYIDNWSIWFDTINHENSSPSFATATHIGPPARYDLGFCGN